MRGKDLDVTNMVWRPPLIRVTQVARPDCDGGAPTALYVQPEWIAVIARHLYRHNDIEGKPQGEVATATMVSLTTNMSYFVLESVEEVARLRDEAFGFSHNPAAVVTLASGKQPE